MGFAAQTEGHNTRHVSKTSLSAAQEEQPGCTEAQDAAHPPLPGVALPARTSNTLEILSNNPGATQQCSTIAGRMNVGFWRCCLDFLVWLGGRLKDGKNVGELVAPPWFPRHGELEVYSALCVPSFLHQMGSTSTSLFGAAAGFQGQ